MNEKYYNNYHWYFVHKNGNVEKYKPGRKRKSFLSKVIGYISDEWGNNTTTELNQKSFSNLAEYIKMLRDEGYSVPNAAAFVMEWAWQHGLDRPNFE